MHPRNHPLILREWTCGLHSNSSNLGSPMRLIYQFGRPSCWVVSLLLMIFLLTHEPPYFFQLLRPSCVRHSIWFEHASDLSTRLRLHLPQFPNCDQNGMSDQKFNRNQNPHCDRLMAAALCWFYLLTTWVTLDPLSHHQCFRI